MLQIGAVFTTPSMTLRVTKLCGAYIKCDYWDAAAEEWKPRGRAENKKRVEAKIASGEYVVLSYLEQEE